MFYPLPCHHEIIGTQLYDYYGFICGPSVHHVSIAAALRAYRIAVIPTQTDGPSLGKVVTPVSIHLPSIHPQFTVRISGFGGSGHLTHCGCLTKVHFRLGDRFGSSFLQIPHWLGITFSPPWAAIPSFFGHPCLHLHFPFSRGNGWTLTSLLTTMPVARGLRYAYPPYSQVEIVNKLPEFMGCCKG